MERPSIGTSVMPGTVFYIVSEHEKITNCTVVVQAEVLNIT
jgi:hypothetical protein